MLTAHALPADRERAFKEGADGYIAKPAEPMKVMQEVRRMLSVSPAVDESPRRANFRGLEPTV